MGGILNDKFLRFLARREGDSCVVVVVVVVVVMAVVVVSGASRLKEP